MTEITFRGLNYEEWIRVPFWRRSPSGYYDPHAGAKDSWTVSVDRRACMFFWHGRGGRPILAFRWGGQRWIDGSWFGFHPLTGTGLVKMLYPAMDSSDEGALKALLTQDE